KVWLKWNSEDVTRVFASMLGEGDRNKYLEIPGSQYSTLPFDKVLHEDELVGLSTYAVYTANVRSWFSLAMVAEHKAIDGSEVVLI
ncbi:MAG: aminomethyl transferase family protein, partial [candidate division Zixibacteria bacterium]|nr:aminomethyl transferase family protein [candidate division Zixibacteria bacterium]NIR62472.1 aminomethyl transferase family protein [candidate division Zixibacteria bacterium]NIS44619.1 aminomethyl transferase family protein [candidate division Zixibacteria bacterium]NIV04788.1 aminomethyl transferase family protein [candidate division Zixibacteria bacterium]NIW39544.1 aminomethyl transferase family protein [candidate division Zixibacteria bacterium]